MRYVLGLLIVLMCLPAVAAEPPTLLERMDALEDRLDDVVQDRAGGRIVPRKIPGIFGAADVPLHNLTDTWTSGAVSYDGLRLVITDTASLSTSDMIEMSCSVAGTEWGVREDAQLRLLGAAASKGIVLLGTNELTIVDGDELGRIDFRSPLEASGTDAILVAASIWAEADDTFAADNNDTDLVFAVATSETAAAVMRLDSAGLYPSTDDGLSLGLVNTNDWSDLFLATGAVINWENSDVTLTHSANLLTLVGGALTVGVDDTGHDVKLFGASAGAYGIYDESEDRLEVRGATAAGPGKLLLSTGELTNVDGGVLGRIDFQAPLDSAGTDAILVGASIWAEADATFSASVNSTELVFATGASETATEKMRIDSSGNVGIGTTTPGARIESFLSASGDGATNDNLALRYNATTKYGQHFMDANGRYNIHADAQGVAGGMIQLWADTSIRFNAEGIVTDAPDMIVVNGGVGIGTTTPDGTFHSHTATAGAVIANTSADEGVFENSGDGGISIITPAANTGYIMFSDLDNDVGSIAYDHGTGMIFTVETAEAMRIDSSQRVIVGHTASDGSGGDSAKLQVHANAGTNAGIEVARWTADAYGPRLVGIKSRNATIGSHTIVQDNDVVLSIIGFADDGVDLASRAAMIHFEMDGTIAGNRTPGAMVFSTTSDGVGQVLTTEAMRIDSSQNVGIGTATVDTLLHMSSTGTTNQLRITVDSDANETGATASLRFENNNSTIVGRLLWDEATSTVNLGYGENNHLTVDANGKVGIGVAAPDGTLHVHTATAGAVTANTSADEGVFENSGDGGISIITPAANTGYVMFSDLDNDVGSIAYDHGTGMIFTVETAEAMRIDSSQRLIVGHTADVSPFSHKVQVHSTGTYAGYTAGRWSNDATPPRISGVKARGAIGTYTIVQDNDAILDIIGHVADGNDALSQAAKISFEVDDASPAADQIGGAIVLGTATTTGNTTTEAMRIDSSQVVIVNDTTYAATRPKLVVGGNVTGSTNAHCFVDEVSYDITGASIGMNSFDSRPTITGTQTYDHFVGMQIAPTYSSTGNIDRIGGFTFLPVMDDASTCTHMYGFKVADATLSGGAAVTNYYGIYASAILDCATNNYLIYSAGGTESYHQGPVGIGVDIDASGPKVHIRDSEVASCAQSTSADTLVIERNSGTGISILTPDANSGSIYFTSPSSTTTYHGALNANYTAGSMALGTKKASGYVKIMAGEWAEAARFTGTALHPGSDDGLALGIANTNDWSDLFLATGGVINWENSDVTLTHSADLLTLGGGALTVTAGDIIASQGAVASTPDVESMAGAATAHAVDSNVLVLTDDGDGSVLTTLTGGVSGQLLTIIFTNGSITVTDTDDGGANTIDLAGTATNLTSADDTVLQLVFDGTLWREVSRSVN